MAECLCRVIGVVGAPSSLGVEHCPRHAEANVARLERQLSHRDSHMKADDDLRLHLASRLRHLEGALRKYGQHRDTCGYAVSGNPDNATVDYGLDCTCGFDAALAGESKDA